MADEKQQLPKRKISIITLHREVKQNSCHMFFVMGSIFTEWYKLDLFKTSK